MLGMGSMLPRIPKRPKLEQRWTHMLAIRISHIRISPTNIRSDGPAHNRREADAVVDRDFVEALHIRRVDLGRELHLRHRILLQSV
jgi:hypothetical protein